METQTFESYLQQVREIASQQPEDLSLENSEIIRLIEEYQANLVNNSSDEAFFHGEHNFYNGNYEQSLKYYLEAKEIPCFQFYCYRASSLISRDRGQLDKALSYAQKALRLDPEDIIMNRLLASLQGVEGFQDSLSPSDQSGYEEEAYSSERNEEEQAFDLQEEGITEAIQTFILGQHPDSHACKQGSCNHGSLQGHQFTMMDESFEEQDVCKNALEQRIRLFQNIQAEGMQAYLQQSYRRTKPLDNMLYVLNGWNFHPAAKPLLFTEESRKSSGGHYLRWNGRGIAINPGSGFLENFHSQGLSIRDIDYVVVTRNSPEAYADVKAISDLNQQLNKTAPDRQIIHYYLHQRVCLELAPFLKPSFKQARNTIHKLEMFLDSPDVEKIELAEGITLHYFLTTMPGASQGYNKLDEHSFSQSNLGIRLELTNDHKKLKLGYLSGIAWSPLLAHHLGHCDIILAAFGNTNPTDYSKLGYNDECLGYFGTATLLEELAPRLMLLTEFGGREGDIRIEVVKKMRAENSDNSRMHSELLAADIGLALDLNSLKIKCSISEASVPAGQVSAVASSDSFGRLRYLSSHYFA